MHAQPTLAARLRSPVYRVPRTENLMTSRVSCLCLLVSSVWNRRRFCMLHPSFLLI